MQPSPSTRAGLGLALLACACASTPEEVPPPPFAVEADHFVGNVRSGPVAWAATPGAVGARIVFLHGASATADAPGIESILRAGARHGMPINMLCWGQLGLFAQIARAHPDTGLVLDHLGIAQPFEPPVPGRPFAELDAVLDLAQLDNVVIKITGACTLSHEAFPYADIRAPVMRIIEAFGEKTGVPVIMNTSFNLKGEPIVESPAHAFNTFSLSGMDYLFLGNYVIDKSAKKKIAETRFTLRQEGDSVTEMVS